MRVDRRGGIIVIAVDAGIGRDERTTEEVAAKLDFAGAVAVGEQAVMPNAMKAVRQHVQQEAPDELSGR